MMVDFGTVVGLLAITDHALSALKTATDAVKERAPDAVPEMNQVHLAMMNVLQKEQEVIAENRNLRERVEELENTLRVRDSLTFHHGAYWRRTQDGLDGPFARLQWDLDKKLVRMSVWDDRGAAIKFHEEKHNDYSSDVPRSFLDENNVPIARELRKRE